MKFLIQFQGGEDTRWIYPTADTLAALRFCAAAVAQANTSGAIPSVTVIQEELPPAAAQPERGGE